MDLMQAFNNKYLKAEPPVAEVGDTVRVHVHIKEGNRERIQVFEGTVIAKKHRAPHLLWRRCGKGVPHPRSHH
mgnify:CR=1 FL=1